MSRSFVVLDDEGTGIRKDYEGGAMVGNVFSSVQTKVGRYHRMARVSTDVKDTSYEQGR